MFPKQTESKFATIRGWGCLLMVYAWIVSKVFKHSFTMQEIEAVFVKARQRAIILDNELPTDGSQGDWYRCWIRDPIMWMKMLAASIGEVADPVMIYKDFAPNFKNSPFYVLENNSKIITDHGAIKGIHFTGKDKDELYNPDPSFELTSIKSVRGWSC